MSILDDIIRYKKTEVEKNKRLTLVTELEKKHFFSFVIISMKRSLLDPWSAIEPTFPPADRTSTLENSPPLLAPREARFEEPPTGTG